MRRAGASAALALAAACATTLEREARRAAEEGVDPAPIVSELARQYESLRPVKRIFDVTLIEGRRRFAGEGAVEFHPDPRRLSLDVYGPHGAAVLHARLEGEEIVVTLPREGEVLSGRLDDPRFAAQTGERALVSPEALGALVGAYDIERLIEGAELSAAVDDGRRTLYVIHPETVHSFTVTGPRSRLVEYRQGFAGRLAYRVRFDDFPPDEEPEGPRHVVLRDYIRDRQLVVDVTQERALDAAGR